MESLKDKAEELILLRKAKQRAANKRHRLKYKDNKEYRDKINEYAKNQYHKTKHKILKSEEYKETLRARSREYYHKNKEKCNERARKWEEDNIDRHKENQKKYKKKYYKENKEYIDSRNKKWVQKNKERTIEYLQQYHKKSMENIDDVYLNYIIKNRGENPGVYTDEMKEVVRLQIQIKRELRT